MTVPLPLKRAVFQRAGGRCEYCGLAQAGQEAQFHVDHIHPLAEGGALLSQNQLAVFVVDFPFLEAGQKSLPKKKWGIFGSDTCHEIFAGKFSNGKGTQPNSFAFFGDAIS